MTGANSDWCERNRRKLMMLFLSDGRLCSIVWAAKIGLMRRHHQRQQPQARIDDDRNHQHRTGRNPGGEAQAMRHDPMIDQSHHQQIAQAAGRQRQQGRGYIDPLQLPTCPLEFVFDQMVSLGPRPAGVARTEEPGLLAMGGTSSASWIVLPVQDNYRRPAAVSDPLPATIGGNHGLLRPRNRESPQLRTVRGRGKVPDSSPAS